MIKGRASFILLLIYVLLSIVLDWNLLNDNSLFVFLKIVVGFYVLYIGLNGVQSKKLWFRGGQVTKKEATVVGWILIILSVIIALSAFVFSFKGVI